MEKELFKLSGISDKDANTRRLIGLITIAVGCLFLFIRNAKSSTVTMHTYLGSGTVLDSGTVGGRYLYDSDTRTLYFIGAIVFILMGYFWLKSIKISNKSYVVFYEDKMVGKLYLNYILVEAVKDIDLAYQDIQTFQMIGERLYVKDIHNINYTIGLKDIQKGYSLINEKKNV